jgi:hypothetical protein
MSKSVELQAFEALIYTASALWNQVKPIKDTEAITVTHPIIERAKEALKALSIQQEADAKLGAAVRKLLTDGQYDLRDSPKSFLSNCERLSAESITAMATPTDSEDK